MLKCTLLFVLLGYISITLALETVFIKECRAGKYFWKQEEPEAFYACLTIPQRAIRMKCSPGSYMCNTGPKVFQPCMCSDENSKFEPTLNEVDPFSINSVQGYPEAKEAPYHQPLNDPSNDVNDVSQNDVTSDDDTGPKAEDDDSEPANGCPDNFRRVLNAHMYKGIALPDATLRECQAACLAKSDCLGVDWNFKLMKCFYLSIDEKDTIRYGLNYHRAINHYRRTHCHSTESPKSDGTKAEAKRADAKRAPTASPTQDTFARTTQGPRSASEANPWPGFQDASARSSTQSPLVSVTHSYDTVTGTFDTVTSNRNAETVSHSHFRTTSESNRNDFSGVTQPTTGGSRVVQEGTTGYSNNINNAVPTQAPRGNRNEDIVTDPPRREQSTTTIPDSGCPYTFEKYEDMSHPFGVNVTIGSERDEEEECKYWCIIVSYCVAVDFDKNTGTCYLLREVTDRLLSSVTGVNHYVKTGCAPPLRCWSQEKFTVKKEEDSAVTDPNTPSMACHGVCFVSVTHGQDGSEIERGCMSVVDPLMMPPLGCDVDVSLMTIVCFCDTPRCNGLSVAALATQMMHLPLDGDLMDHSGMGRHGHIPQGFGEPTFNCLDKAVNCSALFSGDDCVTVTSLAQTQWGEADNKNFLPMATFVVWFKRPSGDKPTTEMQGIFGNSIDASSEPSWQIIAEMFDNYTGAGVSTAANPSLDDYPWMFARNDEWHLAVLTYDGRLDLEHSIFPMQRFSIDGENTVGNAKADRGEIGVRNQPVSIGCVQGKNFVGFIDETRIFSSVLSPSDIKALLTMRDPNHFW